MENKDELIKIRDTFRETADIIDEIIELEGEDTTEEMGCLLGKLLLKMLELSHLQNSFKRGN